MRKREVPQDKLKETVLEYLEERFDLKPELFSDFGFYLASKGRVFLGPKRGIDRPRIVTIGLLIGRVDNAVKPTTNLLQAFGKHIKKNAISLTKEQTISYVKGQDIMLDSGDITDGYVLLNYSGHHLGCGLLKGGTIKNMLPKAKRMVLKHL